MTHEEVWMNAWCAVAGAFNSKVPDCDRYADACLEAFEQRFPERKRQEPSPEMQNVFDLIIETCEHDPKFKARGADALRFLNGTLNREDICR